MGQFSHLRVYKGCSSSDSNYKGSDLMKRTIIGFLLLILLFSLPIFGISIAQDTFFNDAEEVTIQLNESFIELEPGESFKFKATVTGLSSCKVVYSIDNDEYITLSPDGTVTVKENISNFGEQTITLTAESTLVSIKATASILLNEAPQAAIRINTNSFIYYENNGLASY